MGYRKSGSRCVRLIRRRFPAGHPHRCISVSEFLLGVSHASLTRILGRTSYLRPDVRMVCILSMYGHLTRLCRDRAGSMQLRTLARTRRMNMRYDRLRFDEPGCSGSTCRSANVGTCQIWVYVGVGDCRVRLVERLASLTQLDFDHHSLVSRTLNTSGIIASSVQYIRAHAISLIYFIN